MCFMMEVPLTLSLPKLVFLKNQISGLFCFFYYINDLPNVSSFVTSILYAHDTNLFCHIEDISSRLNSELELINSWLQSNTLYYPWIQAKHDIDKLQLAMNFNIINITNEIKFLGVIIDKHLTWKNHINYISNKVSKGIGIIYRANNLLYSDSLHILYETLIKPYFSYCSAIWGNTYQSYLQKLTLTKENHKNCQ